MLQVLSILHKRMVHVFLYMFPSVECFDFFSVYCLRYIYMTSGSMSSPIVFEQNKSKGTKWSSFNVENIDMYK